MRGAAIDNLLRNDADGVTGGYSANSDITLLGGTWDGATSTYPGTNCTLVGFGHCASITVRDVTCQNTTGWHFVEFNACKDALVDNCVFSGGAEQALTTMEAVQVDAAISSTEFPWFGPYDDTHCETVTVRDSRFESCGSGVGTHTDPAAAHQDIKLTGNTFNSCYYAAIRGQGWSGVRVIGNRVVGGYHGVFATPAAAYTIRDWRVHGNTLYQVGTTGYSGAAAGRPIVMGAVGGTQVEDVSIVGNAVRDCTGSAQYAIYVNNSQHFSVVGNTVYNNNDHGIYILGASYGTVCGNEVGLSGGNGIQSSSTTEVAVTGGNRSPKIGLFNAVKAVYTGNIVGTSQTITGTTSGITSPNLVNGTST